MLVGVAVAVAVCLLVGAAVVMDGGPDHPDDWDPRVEDLARFVEDERDLPFDHPVTVEFLTTEEYSEVTRVDPETLSDEERAEIEDSGRVLEALGLVPVDTDLVETTNEMSDSGTLAFYEPITETVRVRGTELTTAVEVTLVHELVHVAQDQAFDLDRLGDGGADDDVEGFTAVVEGDASRIEQAYLETLDQDVQDAYWDDYQDMYDDSQEQLGDVPGALQAVFQARYALGMPLVGVIAADGGNEAVDRAFEAPPSSSEQLLDPTAYLDGDDAVDVDEPEVPSGAEPVGEPDQLGASGLFVVLSERIDPIAALDAADGWGGDAMVAYDDDDTTCVRLAMVGDTPDDTDEMFDALTRWADAGEGQATVALDGDVVHLESCAGSDTADTADGAGGDGVGGDGVGGDGAGPAIGALDAIALPATRSQLMLLAMTDFGSDAAEAFATGDCFVRGVPVDTLTATSEEMAADEEMTQTVQSQMIDCLT